MWLMYFVYMIEDETLNPVNVILRRGKGNEAE
jgi:hypothetical protein